MALQSLLYQESVSEEVFYMLFQDIFTGKFPIEKLDCAVDIIERAMDGGIDISRNLNLSAYVNKINNVENINRRKAQSKMLYIYESDTEYDGENRSGIASSMLKDDNDDYEKLIDDEELNFNVLKLKKMFGEITAEYHIDIVHAMFQARKGIPSAVATLKSVCEEDSQISEIIFSILNSGYELEELFPEYNK